MSSTIMLFNGPNGVWTADPLEFMAAAREQWPEAVVADDPDSGGYHLVGIQFVSPPAGIGADGSFAINPEGAGYFSIRSGVDRASAEMFVWVREWLGPKNECAIVESGNGEVAEVPYGTDADQMLELIEAVSP